MRNALVFYFTVRAPGYTGHKYGYKFVADAHHVPRETFRRHLGRPLKGYFGHVAGGQANQQNFVAISQPSILLTHIHLALPSNLPMPITAPLTPAPQAAGQVPPSAACRALPSAAGRAPVTVPEERDGKQIFYLLFYFFRSHAGITFCVCNYILCFQTRTQI